MIMQVRTDTHSPTPQNKRRAKMMELLEGEDKHFLLAPESLKVARCMRA